MLPIFSLAKTCLQAAVQFFSVTITTTGSFWCNLYCVWLLPHKQWPRSCWRRAGSSVELSHPGTGPVLSQTLAACPSGKRSGQEQNHASYHLSTEQCQLHLSSEPCQSSDGYNVVSTTHLSNRLKHQNTCHLGQSDSSVLPIGSGQFSVQTFLS